MRKADKWAGAALVTAAGLAIASCSSDASDGGSVAAAGSSGEAGSGGDGGGQGGGAGAQAGAAGSQAGSGGSSGLIMNCQPQLPPGWAPAAYVPAVGHQKKCTANELSDFYACYKWGGSSCIDDTSHQECSACMEGPHGTNPPTALISHPGFAELNSAGCLDLLGTDPDCPATWDKVTQCMQAACDPVCPRSGDAGPVFTFQDQMSCRAAATAAGGPCASYVKPADDCANAQLSNMELQKCWAGTFADRVISHGREFCGSTTTSCSPYLPPGYQDPAYVPPVGLHMNVCTEAEVTGFWDACFGSAAGQSCVNFSTAHAACFNCMITNRGAAKWGATIVFFSLNQANTSGCIEAFGHADCAHKVQALQQCQHFACIASCPWDGLDALVLYSCKESAASGVCSTQNAAAETCLAALPSEVLTACYPPSGDADAGSESSFHTEVIGAGLAMCGP